MRSDMPGKTLSEIKGDKMASKNEDNIDNKYESQIQQELSNTERLNKIDHSNISGEI